MGNAQDRYIVLDGLRGVAALSIVVLHSDRYFGDFQLPSAALAVDLFFCLSGFVLALAYEDRFHKGLSPTRFLRQRLIRLYPLYLVGILLGVVYYAGALAFPQYEKEFSLVEVAGSLPFNLLMLPSPVSAGWFPFNGVMWSIFFELVVNLIWVAFYRQLQSTRMLICVIVVSGALFVGISFLSGSMQLGLEKATFVGGLARVCFSFFLGVLIYRFHRRITLPKCPDFLLVGLAVAAFAMPRYLPVELITAMAIMPFLVALGAVSVPSELLSPTWSALGDASYAVYCIHKRGYILSYAVLLQFLGLDAAQFAPVFGFAYLIGVFVVGWLLTRWFDIPARRALWALSARFGQCAG